MVNAIVVWKWRNPEYRHSYTAEHVNQKMRQMRVAYPKPHRFICITDDPRGLDPEIEVIEMPPRYTGENPTFPKGPNCFHRLWLYSEEFANIVQGRFVHIDLDTVPTGDLTELFEKEYLLTAWGGKMRDKRINGSLWVHDAGTMTYVYNDFKEVGPDEATALIREHKCKGSDQGWLQYITAEYGYEPRLLDEHDGVYSFRINIRHQLKGALPEDSKLLVFHGHPTPWHVQESGEVDWIDRYML